MKRRGMGRGRFVAAIIVGAGLFNAGYARADGLSWPDTPSGRANLLTVVQALEKTLRTHASATLALEDWCATHHMAARPVVVAQKAPLSQPDPVPAQVRADLGIGATQAVRHRRVRLTCGTHVLSVADNWYVPDLLTPEMNATLENTDTAFGHVVAPLHFTRERLQLAPLWAPWPGPLFGAASGRVVAPATIMRQRAVLRDGQGRPFSEVMEIYTDQNLDFTPSPDGGGP
ncbi:uncharacterized protein S101446_02846 [Komagataeibacter europaeus]|nr:uncharacterized protein S101446_02846 [Komagataeibacter europaeus]